MKTLKKYLSVILSGCAVLFGLIAYLCGLAPLLSSSTVSAGGFSFTGSGENPNFYETLGNENLLNQFNGIAITIIIFIALAMVVAAVYGVLSLLGKAKKYAGFVALGGALLFVVAGILTFFIPVVIKTENVSYTLSVGTIFMGIMAILGGVILVVSFLFGRKSKDK